MQPHEQRVVEEKQQLDERLEKLTKFIVHSPTFATLDRADQNLLCDQQTAMTDYSIALGKRIARFTN